MPVAMHVIDSINDSLGSLADAVRWPLERLGWAIEQRLLWPLQEGLGSLRERLGVAEGPRRTAAIAAIAVAAVGAGVAGLVWASPGDGERAAHIGVPGPAPVTRSAQPASPSTSPTLHGAPPVLKTAPGGESKLAGSEAVKAAGAAASEEAPASASSAVVPGEAAGPAAIAVARQFSDAFVLYETGQAGAEVRAAFAATATPELARSLLRRPPRLPANVNVPQAKVVNVVAGPKIGDVYTVSVSLLRVGVTSELRLSMQHAKNGAWRVTDVLG
jgi:hypothetical protein